MKNEFEIECYGLHIKQQDWKKAMSKDCAEICKKYDGAIVADSKDPMMYCASVVFKNRADRNNAMKAFKDIGINPVLELQPAYVDRKYAKESWL